MVGWKVGSRSKKPGCQCRYYVWGRIKGLFRIQQKQWLCPFPLRASNSLYCIPRNILNVCIRICRYSEALHKIYITFLNFHIFVALAVFVKWNNFNPKWTSYAWAHRIHSLLYIWYGPLEKDIRTLEAISHCTLKRWLCSCKNLASIFSIYGAFRNSIIGICMTQFPLTYCFDYFQFYEWKYFFSLNRVLRKKILQPFELVTCLDLGY